MPLSPKSKALENKKDWTHPSPPHYKRPKNYRRPKGQRDANPEYEAAVKEEKKWRNHK